VTCGCVFIVAILSAIRLKRIVKKIVKAPINITKKVVKAHVKLAKKAVKVVKKVAPYVAIGAALYFGAPYVITALRAGGAKAGQMISMFTQKRTDEGATPEQIAMELAQMQGAGNASEQSQYQPQQMPQYQPQQMPQYQQPQQTPQYQERQRRQAQQSNQVEPTQTATGMPPWLLPVIAIGASVLLRN